MLSRRIDRVAALLLTLPFLSVGCSGGRGGTTDASAVDAPSHDAAPLDSAVRDGSAPDEGTSRADAGPRDAGTVDAPTVDGGDVEAGGGMCMPSWHPTSCGDCGGTSSFGQCTQGCDPATCGDGHAYVARCDDATHTCHCLIDMVEVCTCTFTVPTTTIGCEPAEWGGSNCCWNVG